MKAVLVLVITWTVLVSEIVTTTPAIVAKVKAITDEGR